MFIPSLVLFEKEALGYKDGQILYDKLIKEKKIEVDIMRSNRITGVEYKDEREKYFKYKKILIISKRKDLKFQSCKPSANYQLPLSTGCQGMCEYCYLNTRFAGRPYVKAYINIDEILNKSEEIIDKANGEEIVFEGAATSDPITVEPYTKGLQKSIEFFSKKENGRFRFVTKFAQIDNLVSLNHNKKTEIRFSINTDRIIKAYEHNVSPIEERLSALKKLYYADYPMGIIIAPVFIEGNWQEEYSKLLESIKEALGENSKIEFEVISHRFTAKAKSIINTIYPYNNLPMEEETRKFKYGQFGYGKYVYTNEELAEMKDFFSEKIQDTFPNGTIKYII